MHVPRMGHTTRPRWRTQTQEASEQQLRKGQIVPYSQGRGDKFSEYDGKRCRTDSRGSFTPTSVVPMRVMVLPHSKTTDGKYGSANLGHCSYYGPTDRFDISNTTDLSGLLKELGTKPEDYDFTYQSAVARRSWNWKESSNEQQRGKRQPVP